MKHEPSRSSHWAEAAIVCCTLSIFGPYVWGPVRTEQITFYSLAVALVVLVSLRFIPKHHGSMPKTDGHLTAILIVGLAILTSSVLGHMFEFGPGVGNLDLGFLAGLDSFLYPISVLLVIYILAILMEPARAAHLVSISLAGALVANTLVTLLLHATRRKDYLSIFHQSLSSEFISVADRSFRLTGIFNQPVEAGLAYSISALLLVTTGRFRLTTRFVMVAAVSFGGFLSASKVFSLGGIFVVLAAFALIWGVRTAGWASVCSAGLFFFALPFPYLGDHYFRIWAIFVGDSKEEFIKVLTAGRFSALPSNQNPTSSGEVLTNTDQSAPAGFYGEFFGYGPSMLVSREVVLDTAYTHVTMTSGLLGLALYLAGLCVLLSLSALQATIEARYLGLGLTVLLLASGLGFEPLTSNRSGTIVWAVIAMLAACRRNPSILARIP